MEVVPVCRICLATEATKNISDLKSHHSDKTSYEIMLFCLNVQVDSDSKVSSKLCLKCFRKIIAFFNFKLLALKNDVYLKNIQSTSNIKTEILNDDDFQNEGNSLCDSDISEVPLSNEIKLEPIKYNGGHEASPSDDELLSVIKKIKYEYTPDDINNGNEQKSENTKKEKNSKSKTHICEECGKIVKDLKNHMLGHGPKEVRKRIPCNLCDKTFSSNNARQKHKQRKHLGLKQTCPICGKVVTTLSTHTLLSHNQSALPHQCVPCGRRFISRSALEAHVTVHTKDRPFPCTQCDKRFRTKLNLNLHQRQVHEKERTHLCQFCSKSFFKKYHLQVHLRSHTKERPYSCSQCGAAFASTTTLKNHMSTHSREKNFKCALCDMSFARHGYLKVHMLSHTREKRHPCKYCGVKFLRSDHRKRHEFTAHEKHNLAT